MAGRTKRLSGRPVKFGAICAPALASMLWDEHYHDDKALILDLCDIMNAEFRELAAAGCPVIQVEEPRHHGLTTMPDYAAGKDREFQTEAFNRQLKGNVDAEVWVHTCWGSPNQQRVRWEVPSYEARPAPPAAARLRRDHLRMRQRRAAATCRSSPATRPTRRIGIGVVNHCNTVVEPPENTSPG